MPTPTKLTIHLPGGDPTSTSIPFDPANAIQPSQSGSDSPKAPPFSPITPKTQPTFPATYPAVDNGVQLANDADTRVPNGGGGQTVTQQPAQYIPPPPPQPFSSKDSTDAIALRAAISALQFQKKKAQEDLRALEEIKTRAVSDPELFKTELLAGRLKEQKEEFGGTRGILDATSDDDDHDDDHDDEDDNGDEMELDAEDGSSVTTKQAKQNQPPFANIPGPQTVIRMPYINWEKYHIHGEALDRLHEQQRKWPGSFDYASEKGREFTVAAPYSPWTDSLVDARGDGRRDSLNIAGAVATPSTSVSEHTMETRRGGKH